MFRVHRNSCAPFAAAVLLGALCSSVAAAEQPDLKAPLPVDPNIRLVELPNGMHLWMRANQRPPGRVSMWLHVGSGSINEEDDQRGLAHFLEHMAFRGSEHFPPGELIKYFESIGLTFGHDQNAFTGFDQTTYTLTLPDTKEETLRRGLLCLADFAFRLSLLQDQIDKERGVVLEEFRARKGPRQRVFEKLLPELLPGSRVAKRLPIGKEEVVRRVNSEDLRRYYATWYRPDNTTLLVVGDIDPETVEKLVRDAFADWRHAPNPKPPADPGVRPYATTRATVITDPELTAAEVSVVRVMPLEPMKTVGDFRRELVDELGIWIVNRRLADMVRAGTAPFQDAAVTKSPLLNVATYADAEADGKPEKWQAMLRTLITEIKRAREHGFLEQEFADARKAALADAEKAAQMEPTKDSRAFLRYMNDMVSQCRKPIAAAQRLELTRALIGGITLDEVLEAFRRNFDAKARLLVLTMPQKDDLPAPPTQALLSLAEEVEASQVAPPEPKAAVDSLLDEEPTPGEIIRRDEDADLGILSVTMRNGVRVHLRSMDYKKDQVLVKIVLAGGALRETEKNRGITSAAALILSQPASQSLSSTQIRDYMTGKKVAFGGGVTPDSVAISISGPPDTIEEGFRLAYLVLTQPRLEASALKVWKERMAQEIKKRKHSVEDQLFEHVDSLLSGGDARMRFPTQQQVDAVTLEEAQSWLEEMARTAPVEASVVGDMDLSDELELALKYLGSLPHRRRVDPSLNRLRRLRWQRGPLVSSVEVDTVTPRAVALVGWRGADWKDVKDRRALQVAAQILRGRLRDQVRSERGLTYTPFCYSRAAKEYPGTGLFAAVFTADPGEAASTTELVRAIVEQFAKDGPTDAEMATVRKQFANLIETQQKEPGYWSNVLADLDYHGTRLSDVKEALEAYTGYTARELRAVLNDYITDRRHIQVIAMPKAKSQTPLSAD